MGAALFGGGDSTPGSHGGLQDAGHTGTLSGSHKDNEAALDRPGQERRWTMNSQDGTVETLCYRLLDYLDNAGTKYPLGSVPIVDLPAELRDNDLLTVCHTRKLVSYCRVPPDAPNYDPAKDCWKLFLSDEGHACLAEHRLRNRTPHDSKGTVTQNDQVSPKTDPSLIYQCAAADLYNIPKSTLSKAADKSPGEFGYLWSGTEGSRRFYKKADLVKLSRSRQKLSGG